MDKHWPDGDGIGDGGSAGIGDGGSTCIEDIPGG